MLIRKLYLYINYWYTRIKNFKTVKFNGYTICFAFANSCIIFKKGPNKTIINSDFVSNLIGLYQRSIIIARYGGKITIGAGCGISGSTIYSMKEIIIGDNVFIGANCKIIDNDFHPTSSSLRINQQVDNIKKKTIKIGNECFIGTNSIILKGTILGNNCVVGAGSVVSGIYPDNVIIAGNPAKIIKSNI